MTNLEATGGVPGPGRIGRVAIGDLLKRAAAMPMIATGKLRKVELRQAYGDYFAAESA